jgi:propanediol utilization protein
MYIWGIAPPIDQSGDAEGANGKILKGKKNFIDRTISIAQMKELFNVVILVSSAQDMMNNSKRI